jgi:TonB-dependent receptor
MSLGSLCRRLSGISLFLTILSVQALYAQGSGTIKGKVIDKVTGDDLPGANIVVINTSLGAAADLDGNFVLHFVPVGKWTIKVSYIGYNAITDEIDITENATVVKNFSLTPTTLMGEEVVVTAQARGQAEAINQQLTSNRISNIVSEARIQELPDFNAAQAISRLPGISATYSSGEANKVVIRGLDPKYNQITVDGVGLASTGSSRIGFSSQGGTDYSPTNDRSVDIANISPYMIKSISVYKSLTPDLNADAIGGIVNMDLREAPSDFHSDLLWQSGYTQKSNTYGNYRAVATASGRVFKDKLGLYVLGNIESYNRDADNMTGLYTITSSTDVGANSYLPVKVTQIQLNKHVETRKRYGGNLILDYRLPSGSIKFVNMLSRLSSDAKDYRTIYDFNSLTQDLIFRYRGGVNDVDLAVNTLKFENDFGFFSLDLTAASTYSRNNLPSAPDFQFTETRGVGTATVNTRPEDLVYLVNYRGPGAMYLANLGLYSSDYKENNQEYKGNFKIPFNVKSTVVGYLKFGGEYKYSLHKNAQNTPYASITGATPVQTRINNYIRSYGVDFDTLINRFPSTSFGSPNTSSFLADKFGNMIWLPNPGLLEDITKGLASDPSYSADSATALQPGGWFDGYFQKLPNTYKYIEKYYAGYVMTELNYGRFMVVGGVRYEKVQSLYDAYNLLDGRDTKSQRFFPVFAHPENEFWLPMVNSKFNVADWFDIRYAYTQTLARPDYHMLSPHFTIGYSSGAVWSGNPKLRPAHAYNHDLILTFHSSQLGLLSIGGFYKTVKDFAYSTTYTLYQSAPAGLDSTGSFVIGGSQPATGTRLYTYINSPYLAYIKGVEIDLQTNLWYLRPPFNGIVIGINYTRIESKATYPWRNPRTYYPPRPQPSYTIVIDSTRAGRLINQPNDILNSYVGYDYRGFSARVSFIFQGNTVSSVADFAENDGLTQDYFRIDASVRQQLPWTGTEIFLDLNNLNNESNVSTQPSIGGFTNEQNYGFTANLGIRFRL